MGRIAYTVTATIPTPETAREYVDWLVRGHLAEVVAGGALSAEVIGPLETGSKTGDSPGMTSDRIVIETRYTFATLSAFRAYEQEHAPRLRAEGLEKFGPQRGIRFERRLGEIIDRPSEN